MNRALRRDRLLGLVANRGPNDRCEKKEDFANMGRSPTGVTQMSRSNIVMAALVGLGGIVTATQAAEFDPCPTGQLAPLGIVPTNINTALCNQSPGQSGCLVSFAGYQWWTAFNFYGSDYGNQYYFNSGLATIFAPNHVSADGQGLHLVVNNDTPIGVPGQGNPWSGAEAVAMFKRDGSEANLGYGDYLVTIKSAPGTPTLDMLDPNVSVGMFTYERYGPFVSPAATYGSPQNPWREIDLAELSRWGWNHTGACPFSGMSGQFHRSILCQGNAQFAMQDFTKTPIGVQRYDLGANTTLMTLVMQWRADQVTYLKFDRAVTLAELPRLTHTALSWTTPTELRPASNFSVKTPPGSPPGGLATFVPNPTYNPPNPPPGRVTPQACMRFHLNFWTGAFGFGNQAPSCPNCNPGPATRQEVIITNFEYRPESP